MMELVIPKLDFITINNPPKVVIGFRGKVKLITLQFTFYSILKTWLKLNFIIIR